MNAKMYRIIAIQTLGLTKLFAIAVLWGRTTTVPTGAFTTWNTLLAIVFSFCATASWMLAGMKES